MGPRARKEGSDEGLLGPGTVMSTHRGVTLGGGGPRAAKMNIVREKKKKSAPNKFLIIKPNERKFKK